jgi:hypothetical protein
MAHVARLEQRPGCVSCPSASSNGSSAKGDGVAAMKLTASSTTRDASSGAGKSPASGLAALKALHSEMRSVRRAARSAFSSRSIPYFARNSRSLPRHQAATGGRSWVEVIAIAFGDHADGAANRSSSRSNQRTLMP